MLNNIYINNAGLVIASPFLEMLFERAGLMNNQEFIDDRSKSKAVHLLEYLVIGENNESDSGLLLNKLFCGLPVSFPIAREIEISEHDKELVDDLLIAIINHWETIGSTTIEGLRVSFLQRGGKLEEMEDYFSLKVDQKAIDVLMDRLPWKINPIELSWMKKRLLLEWM